MLRLRRLHILKYRSIASNTELVFGDDHVFLLGRNGSGKTTLLNLLGNLISCRLAPFLDEDSSVDIEWELEREQSSEARRALYTLRLHLTVDPDTPHVPIESHPQPLAPPRRRPRWTFEGALLLSTPEDQSDTDQDEITSADQDPTKCSSKILSFRYAWNETPTLDPSLATTETIQHELLPLPFENDFLLMFAYHFTRVDDLNNTEQDVKGIDLFKALVQFAYRDRSPRRFDEELGTFNAIVGAPSDQTFTAGFDNRPDNIFTTTFIPIAIIINIQSRLNIIERAAPRVSISNLLTNNNGTDAKNSTAKNLLGEALDLLGAKDIEIHPRLQEKDPKGTSVWRGFDIYVQWPGGVTHNHAQLSFGQKRLLAFMWYADVSEGRPLLTDELTNGFHAGWVRRLSELLEGRQAFHAIQNPLLLDMTGPGAEDEIPGQFIFCETLLFDEGRKWRWRNPSVDEARRLRKAWDAGFQQLSEVLLSEGLW